MLQFPHNIAGAARAPTPELKRSDAGNVADSLREPIPAAERIRYDVLLAVRLNAWIAANDSDGVLKAPTAVYSLPVELPPWT